MTGALKQEEEIGHLKVDEIKTDGKKRRANTFPDEARLTWVEVSDRVDRVHLEPRHRLHQGQPGLQALLRRAHGRAAPGDGAAELPQRVSSSRCSHTCWSCRSRWKKPQTIFVNSMSDLFHEDVPLDYIQRVFDVMRRAHWHRFQVLTKRAERLAELDRRARRGRRNVWMGVSVESDEYTSRIDDLRATRRATEVPVARAAARAACRPRLCGHRLGHRRRRVRPEGAADGPRVGHRHPRPVPAGHACRSSSSSGAGRTRSKPGASSTGGPGTRCPTIPSCRRA